MRPTGDREVERLRQRYLLAVRDSIIGHHLATPSVVPTKHHNATELRTTAYAADKRARGVD